MLTPEANRIIPSRNGIAVINYVFVVFRSETKRMVWINKPKTLLEARVIDRYLFASTGRRKRAIHMQRLFVLRDNPMTTVQVKSPVIVVE